MKSIEFRNELWDFLKNLSTGLEHILRPTVESYGLTILQARILVELNKQDQCTVGYLSDLLGSGSGNTSTLCKKLERTGFIVRERDSQDERVVNISLTDYGANMVCNMEKELQDKFDPVLKRKTDEDFAIIIGGMKKLEELMAELCDALN